MSLPKPKPHSILSRLAAPLALVFVLPSAGTAHAAGLGAPLTPALGGPSVPLWGVGQPELGAPNRIDGLTVEELDDGTTVLRLEGSRKPTFNVYRLSSPERLVVDVAGSEPGKVVPHIPLDTWACGRVTVDGVQERDTNLVRLVVELKREASYIVLPKDGQLVVTVTPREVAPEAYFARKSAHQRRVEIERSEKNARALEAEARALSEDARRKAAEADRKVNEARGKAETARKAEVRAKAAERRAAKAEQEARQTLDKAQGGKLKLRRALRKAEQARSEAEAERRRAEAERKTAEGSLAKARTRVEAERKRLERARGETEAERKQLQQERGRVKKAEAAAKAELARAEKKSAQAEREAARVLESAQDELAAAKVEASRSKKQASAQLRRAEREAAKAAKAAKAADAAANKKLQAAAAQAERELTEARANAAKTEAEAKRTLASAKSAVAAAEAEAEAKQREAKKAEARAKLLLLEARAKAEHESSVVLAAAHRAESEAKHNAQKILSKAEAEAKAKVEAAAKAAERKAEQELAAAKREAQRRLAAAKAEAKASAVKEAERELAKIRAQGKQEVERQVAKAKAKAEREAQKDLSRARARAESLEAEAKAKLAQAETTLANAQADAARKKKDAAALRAEAKAALARANTALAEAEAERKAASRARRAADDSLAKAKAEVARARKKGKSTAELERTVSRAEQDKQDAQRRLASAKHDISRLRGDRDALERTLTQQRAASKALAGKIEARSQELHGLEKKVARARKALAGSESKLEQRRDALASEGDSLRKRNAAAKSELDKAEAQLARLKGSLESEQGKLRKVEQEVLEAQQKLDARVAAREAAARAEADAKAGAAKAAAAAEAAKAAKPEAEAEPRPSSPEAAGGFVRDVRFEDDGTESRVIVEMQGPVRFEGKTLTPDIQVLALKGARIDPRLERSLDASAYAGPVDRVTSFSEDGGAKVIVATNGPSKPRLESKDGTLVWHFPHGKSRKAAPRHEVASLPGSKVGGYAASAPPSAMPVTTTAMMAPTPPPGTGPRSLPGATSGSGQPVIRSKRWRGERIDIELQDAPIKDVLLLFSDIGRVNIIAGRNVEGDVTMKLNAVPWDQALDIILRSLNLGMVREGNVIRVATSEDLDAERRAAIEQANARVQLKPLQTRLVPVSYATVDEMIPKVQSVLSPRGTVTPDSRTNTLIIMDVADNIALAEQLVASLDTQTPQVLIEARIVEARTSFVRQLGIQWGFDFIASPGTGNPTGLLFPNSAGVGGGATGIPVDSRGLILPAAAANPNYVVDLPAPVGTGAGGAIGFSFGSISGNLNTNLRISQSEETGEVRIISSPKIVTLDNSEAQIEDGVQIPISQVSAQGVNTRFVNATLSLRVTPHVTNEGAVLLDVQVQKNEADFVNTGARGDPTILTKQARSRMLVNDSDTAVIGGIYSRNKAVSFTKVPWLADIPIIGWFFKNKREADTRSEVLIFLTPKIVNRASSIGG